MDGHPFFIASEPRSSRIDAHFVLSGDANQRLRIDSCAKVKMQVSTLWKLRQKCLNRQWAFTHRHCVSTGRAGFWRFRSRSRRRRHGLGRAIHDYG